MRHPSIAEYLAEAPSALRTQVEARLLAELGVLDASALSDTSDLHAPLVTLPVCRVLSEVFFSTDPDFWFNMDARHRVSARYAALAKIPVGDELHPDPAALWRAYHYALAAVDRHQLRLHMYPCWDGSVQIKEQNARRGHLAAVFTADGMSGSIVDGAGREVEFSDESPSDFAERVFLFLVGGITRDGDHGTQ